MELECWFCKKNFLNRSNLKRHLFNIHKVIEKRSDLVELKFQSMSEFLLWKARMEEKTLSMYVKRRYVCYKRNNTKYSQYECCRSGQYVPGGTGKRSLKSQKSAKIGKRCPSRITLKVTDNEYFVKFYKDHEGHGTDIEHLRLPHGFRAALFDKIKAGIPTKEIIDEIRDKSAAEGILKRTSLVNRKDLYNIKKEFNRPNRKIFKEYVMVKTEQTEDEESQDGDLFPEEVLTEEEVVATDECFSEIQFQEGLETSAVSKAEDFIELYSRAGLSDEEDQRVHELLDSILTICYESLSKPQTITEDLDRSQRPIEIQMEN